MSYIFNVGLNRAGTSSLNDALNDLGISALHHRHDGKRLPDIVKKNKKEGRNLFHGLTEKYQAFTDFSGWNYYKTLDVQYPGSKFIFTYRYLKEWLESLSRHNKKHGGKIDIKKWTYLYNTKVPEIVDYFFYKDNFLLIDITRGEGWEKLCPFFNKPIPKIPFPHKNKSK
jgi:hypothetical protein